MPYTGRGFQPGATLPGGGSTGRRHARAGGPSPVRVDAPWPLTVSGVWSQEHPSQSPPRAWVPVNCLSDPSL